MFEATTQIRSDSHFWVIAIDPLKMYFLNMGILYCDGNDWADRMASSFGPSECFFVKFDKSSSKTCIFKVPMLNSSEMYNHGVWRVETLMPTIHMVVS